MLRALVEKVEAHLQKKMRIRSLHASSSFRQLEIDRSGADYSDETQEGLLFSGDYDAEYVKEETAQAKADRVERDAAQYSVRPRHPISPVSLETPIEAYRQHSSAATRRRDEINRNVRQDRSARIAVQFDNDIAYYDRWGRPVYRQELSVNGEEFETGSSSDAAREVSRVSYREQVSRLPPHRHWQYVDEPGWSRQNRGYAHVSPAAASEERSTPPSGSARRQKASIHRRYAPYHRNDIYDDDQFEEDLHGHSASREAARVSSFQTDARYSEYENEDLLEHEEDILAAQEYAARSRAQPTYTGRRSAKRPPGQFRQVSPPPYQQKRAAPVDVSSHRAYGYRDGQDGEWLSGDEGHDIVYRRYRYSRQPAMLYPHVYREYQATQGTHRRPDNFSLPDEHPRSAQTESSIARMSKRQKMSSESQGAGIRHAENSDLPFVKSTEDARSYNPDAIDVESDDDVAAPDDETIARQVDYNVPIVYTEHGETSQQPNHVESELVSISSEKRARDAAGESAELEEREKLQDLADEAAPLGKSAIEEDELTGGEQADEKTQQLQACEVVVSLGESGLAAESIIDGAAAVNQEGNARDRAHADTSLPSALLVGISGSDQEIAGETSPVVHQSPEMSTHPPPDSMMASAEPDQVGERADLTQAGVQPAPINPITQHHPSVNNSRTRANELLVASLQMNTSLEAECAQAQEDVKSHLTKYLSVETKSKLLARLDELSRAVFDLQCQVVSSGCKLDTSTRRQMLDVLDGALQTSTRVEKSTQDKIDLLKDGIERALLLCSCDLSVDTQAQDSAVEETFVPNATQSPEIALDAGVFEDSASDDNNWDNTNGWFENADDHYEMEPFEEAEEAVAADADLADDQDMPLVPKKEEDAILTPIESLSFASSLFSETSSCSPTSFVMKGMQKRLLGEIERAHSYYYLHPVNLADPPDSPLKSRSSCEFGCLSGSAGGWVQKVTSQISSRMKWFDEVTYSLARARSGGGNAEAGGELLNRKKMNSTIRKLHLMAIQLHCLVSHLYCIRGRAVCKEGDSLTAALNGSYFERRMTAYKSRLKLDADLHGTPEELLRDTFEFFPEFLLCIEMWGYDYREGTGGDVNRTRKSVKALPLGFFERVEAAVFDYELDKNGFLQTICEELLSIVCLWNDFVWSDNLQTLPVARIAAFEMDMKTSVAKILQTYSLHLMGSWAVRLLANPDELQGLRFTQQNAYYAESSKIRGLVYNSTSHGQCSSGKSSNAAAVGGVTVREEVSAGEYDEELLKKYWALKADASGGRAIQDKSADEQLSSCANISVEAIEKWGKETAAAHLLKWSRVFQLRGELETCGVVLSDLARGVPSQDISSVCGDHVAAAEVLLGIVKKARIVGVDVAAGSDAIALHSASIQLPQEIKLLHEASSGVQKEQNSEGFIAAAVEEEEEQGSRTTEHVDGGGLSEQLSGHGEPPMFSSNSNNNNTSSSSSSSSSDVKDLIQILASTKKEVEEIFCARTRSGRMRDKLQAQSAQLAQQTIDLFHTIAAMRAA